MRTARCICSCGIEVRYRKFNRSIKRYADASRPANRMLFFIDKCMKILVLIASLGSSPEVVQNFLSLLSSKNGIISPLEPVYMKTMTAIVSKSALRPYAYFPLVSNGIKVSLPNIQSKALTNGFTFGCWLFAFGLVGWWYEFCFWRIFKF